MPIYCALLLAGCVLGASVALAARSTPTQLKPGAVDIGFSEDMITHHEQAVEMAQAVTTPASPEIRSLANTIETTQLGEIGTMQGWLQLWNAPPTDPGAPMQWMTTPDDSGTDMNGMSDMNGMKMDTPSASVGTTALMPGMATAGEVSDLSNLTGRALDVSFLQLMTRHHQGGILMAAYASQHARLPQVRATADRMLYEEEQEVNLMLQLLRGDHAKPLPFAATS